MKRAGLIALALCLLAIDVSNIRLVERAAVAESSQTRSSTASDQLAAVDQPPKAAVAQGGTPAAPSRGSVGPVTSARIANARFGVQLEDSPQFGVSRYRNNVSLSTTIPVTWDVAKRQNIKWSSRLGSHTFGTPVVANGKLFIGTNNEGGYVPRFPKEVDLGVLLCFNAATGEFLWQHSTPKHPAGRAHDWEREGIHGSPYVERDRLWYVNNRDELCCLDTEGFHDGENDGPIVDEPNRNADEADIVWKLDLIDKLGAKPRRRTNCSVTAEGDTLFLTTSLGVGRDAKPADHADAPAFLAVDKKTGAILWTDATSSPNIMNQTGSSPCFGFLGGEPQVIFGGGDGWLYSFAPRGEGGKSKLLWKFDCNPKASLYKVERATRNPVMATPVIYDGLVYVGVGDDPEHGEGPGQLWCVDPTKRGDVSPTLVFSDSDPATPIPYRRLQALDARKGEVERPNPNSAAVWQYVGPDPTRFETTMHRTLSSVAILNDLLFVADENGVVHCLDAKTGQSHWTHDLLNSSWSTPLVAGEKIYFTDLGGVVTIFGLSKEKRILATPELGTPIYTTPIVAGGVLYIATQHTLYAIQE